MAATYLALRGLLVAALAALAGARLHAATLAQKGRSLYQKGERKLGRGFLSLALHLDPFMPQDHQELGPWLTKWLQSETTSYWKGSVFIGHDKTFLESLFPKAHLFPDGEKASCAVFTWRNLQLTGLSCCGMDNVAVFFQQANKHMYLIPFMNLVPGYGERLKPENQAMYKSFRQWWEETGRRGMPDPPIQYLGGGKFEWSAMKVALKPSRIPAGWQELIEAVLAFRVEERESARMCAQAALGKNPELKGPLRELLPELDASAFVPLAPVPAAQEKYIVCYNPHVGLGNLAVVMVSAHVLAKLTGRKLLLHWNVNTVSRSAYKLRELPTVAELPEHARSQGVIFHQATKHIYLFHMMNSDKLGETLELLGCSDLQKDLSNHPVVTVSSNLFFAPILGANPHTPAGAVPSFPELLLEMFAPSDTSAERARGFLRASEWGKTAPVIAVHIRAREENEDNDDWPTASSPNLEMLDRLKECLRMAVHRELKGAVVWDVFVASTTEAARAAVVGVLQGKANGPRRVLTLQDLHRNRRDNSGAQDAMTEALILSRADVFMRMVVGTSGFSTFAYFSNALRSQNDWVDSMPEYKRSGFAPNYLVTADCGPGRCYLAPPDVRMASISWHGKQYTQRSCGDVIERVERKGTGVLGCRGLQDVDPNDEGVPTDEL